MRSTIWGAILFGATGTSLPVVAESDAGNVGARAMMVEQSRGPEENCTLPAGTPVEIETASAVGSQSAKIGDLFQVRLTRPLIVGGKIVAPAGTLGSGEVIHAAKRKSFVGANGELILTVRKLSVGNAILPLRGFQISVAGQEGILTIFTGYGVVQRPVGRDVEVEPGIVGTAKVAVETVMPCEPNVATSSLPETGL